MSQLHDSDNRVLHYRQIQERHQPVWILMLQWQYHNVSTYFIPPSLPLSPAVFHLSPLLPLLFFSSSSFLLLFFLFSPSLLLLPPLPLYSRPFPSFSSFTPPLPLYSRPFPSFPSFTPPLPLYSRPFPSSSFTPPSPSILVLFPPSLSSPLTSFPPFPSFLLPPALIHWAGVER